LLSEDAPGLVSVDDEVFSVLDLESDLFVSDFDSPDFDSPDLASLSFESLSFESEPLLLFA